MKANFCRFLSLFAAVCVFLNAAQSAGAAGFSFTPNVSNVSCAGVSASSGLKVVRNESFVQISKQNIVILCSALSKTFEAGFSFFAPAQTEKSFKKAQSASGAALNFRAPALLSAKNKTLFFHKKTAFGGFNFQTPSNLPGRCFDAFFVSFAILCLCALHKGKIPAETVSFLNKNYKTPRSI